MESAIKLQNIKSKYILKKIFDNLKEKKFLIIIQHNKKLQEKLDMNINNFKNYSQIEIEIKPVKDIYGKFINNLNEEDEKYYHIYFNNDEREIKRSYLKSNESIEKIKIIIDYTIESFSCLFKDCECIESIEFKNFKRDNIIYMNFMFEGCINLRTINLSKFNTENVTYMNHMFDECISLNELNISKFKIRNCINMQKMFLKCEEEFKWEMYKKFGMILKDEAFY